MNLDSCPYKVVAIIAARAFWFQIPEGLVGAFVLVLPQVLRYVWLRLGPSSGREDVHLLWLGDSGGD